jgi:hypothetical protein
MNQNPPIPSGWKLMQQSNVTPAMTAFAVALLNDKVIDMFDQVIRTFYLGTTKTTFLNVLARVEWHPADANNHAVHRGVTLYEPAVP